jgi:hypothetical protein
MSFITTGSISHLSVLEQEFERHPIRRKSVSWIELRFPDGSGLAIKLLAQSTRTLARGISRGGSRPIGFIWHNPGAITVTPFLIDWIQSEFRHIFTSDPIMWTASAYTAPEKLQPILLGMQ